MATSTNGNDTMISIDIFADLQKKIDEDSAVKDVRRMACIEGPTCVR